LQKSWPDLKAQGIVFIGIDGPENTSNALKFIQKYGITYPNVQDTVNGATAIDYGATGFPETIFIDRNGVVVAKWAFPLNKQGLQLELAKLAR
jgi:cytochrome c biogenesis protein CcmG/thiol:disulfide interchange protein DsbE